MSILPEVTDGLRGWRLGRVISVVDRGFSSDEHLRYLTRAGGHWIAGERMRDGSPDAAAALSRQERYPTVRENLRVKGVREHLVSRVGSSLTGCARQDLVGGLGPDERLAAFVVAVDKGADRGDEVPDGVKGAAADRLAGDDREEHLDQVQPRP